MKCFKTVLVLLWFVAGCATAPKVVPPVPDSLAYLCEQYSIAWEWDRVTQIVTLKKEDQTAKALIGSDSVVVGANEIFLSGPIKREKNDIIVPPDFKKKIIYRVAKVRAAVSKEIFKIVLDAGHGGKDPGAIGKSGVLEKDVVLDIARRLNILLEKGGLTVFMTRDRDQFFSLEERAELAVKEKADFFVSIHANSSQVHRVQGVEVWSARELEPEEKKEPQREKNHRLLFENAVMDHHNANLDAILDDMLYDYQQKESQKFALYVSGTLAANLPIRDRGAKKAGYFVLRNNLIPAILVEVGFLSNTAEEALLKQDSYRQSIADYLAKSILEYVGQI